MRTFIVTAFLLASLGACDTPAPPAQPVTEAPVAAKPAAVEDAATRAAAIAKEIKAAPDQAAAILAKHGMTEAEFEALLFEVAESPALSARYGAALK